MALYCFAALALKRLLLEFPYKNAINKNAIRAPYRVLCDENYVENERKVTLYDNFIIQQNVSDG